jgi:hypothetical protein
MVSPEPDGIAYTVHNGFLSATVRYGIAGGLAFGCMFLGFLLVPARRATASNAETFVLPLIAAVLILYNMTEDFSSPGQTIPRRVVDGLFRWSEPGSFKDQQSEDHACRSLDSEQGR